MGPSAVWEVGARRFHEVLSCSHLLVFLEANSNMCATESIPCLTDGPRLSVDSFRTADARRFTRLSNGRSEAGIAAFEPFRPKLSSLPHILTSIASEDFNFGMSIRIPTGWGESLS